MSGEHIPATTNWVVVGILMTGGNKTSSGPDNGSTEEIKHGIYQRGQDGHGRHRQNNDEFTSEENDVGDQVDVDGQRDNRVVAIDFGFLEPGQQGARAAFNVCCGWRTLTADLSRLGIRVREQWEVLGGAENVLGSALGG